MTQDPFDQDDWAAYAEFNKKCGKDKLQLSFQETKLWNICRKLMQSLYLYVKTMVSCRFSLLKNIEKTLQSDPFGFRIPWLWSPGCPDCW